MKACAWCGENKNLDQFYRHERNTDKLHSYCKSCIEERRQKKLKSSFEQKEKERKRDRDRYRKKRGIPLDPPAFAVRKPIPGSRHINGQGYVIISRKGHPNAAKDHRIAEHIWVMSEHLGRPIRKGETIHHKNGIRDDNRIKNLELWNSKHLPGQRVNDKIAWCKEFLDEYGYDVIKR